MLFSARKNLLSEAPQMGFRSLFVLAKLGFDLRCHYDYLLEEPMPDEFRGPLEALAERDVIAFPRR